MSKWNTLFHTDTFQKANRRYLFIHRNSIPTIKAVLIVETLSFKILQHVVSRLDSFGALLSFSESNRNECGKCCVQLKLVIWVKAFHLLFERSFFVMMI